MMLHPYPPFKRDLRGLWLKGGYNYSRMSNQKLVLLRLNK